MGVLKNPEALKPKQENAEALNPNYNGKPEP